MIQTKEDKLKRLFIHIGLITFIVLITLPFLMVLSISLRAGNLAVGSLIPENFSLEHWALALGFNWTDINGNLIEPRYPVITWLWNSVKIALISAASIVLLSTTSAYAFSRFKFRGRENLLKFLMLIQVFPAVLALTAFYAFFNSIGSVVDWLGVNSHWTLVVAYSGGIIMHIWTIKGYYDTIDVSLDEAAIIDGASRWETFRYVMLPLSGPVLAVVFILAFIGIVGEFPLASIMLNEESKLTLAVGMRLFLQKNNYLWGDFAAAAILSGIPITIVFLYAQRWIVDGLTAGGVKG